MTKAIIKTLLSKLLNTPLIIEEGTSGIWMYRKWSDGVAECWGNTGQASRAITNSYAGQYYQNIYQALPSGLFNSVLSVVSCRADIGASNGDLVGISLYNVNTAAIQGYIYTSRSVTLNAGFSFFVKGRWKNVGG